MWPCVALLFMNNIKLKSIVAPATGSLGEATQLLPVRERSPTGQVATASPHCLVVSESRLHGESIRTSATKSGWISVVHRDPLDALRESVLRRFHLAIVDVSRGERREEYERLVGELRAGSVPLVVVCGPADDETVEVRMWRQGIWSYVSGLHLGEELTQLFTAAREVAGRVDLRLQPIEASESR